MTIFIFILLQFCGTELHADTWDDLFRQAGLTREQIKFDPLDLQQVGGAELQTPFFKALHGEPLRIPFYARLYRDAFLQAAPHPFDLATLALGRVGTGTRRALEGDPLAQEIKRSAEANALLNVIARLHVLGGKSLTVKQRRELEKRAAGLSAEAAKVVAFLLEAEAHAFVWRQRALENVREKDFLPRAWSERMEIPKADDYDNHDGLSAVMRRLVKDVDVPALMAGGLDLISGVERATERLRKINLCCDNHFEWSTPLGDIVVRGAETDDVYPDKPYLLIIDAGGNDTYYGGGATYDLNHPVSVLIDLKGNDRYLAPGAELSATTTVPVPVAESEARHAAKAHPSFGAGLFGYGILVDVAGDDLYRSYRQTQGRGDFGVGLLWDLAGDDHYDCWVECQGAGDFGAGFLIDGAGADHYAAFQQAQGFAGPRAAGILLDAGAGDDVYLGNDSVLDFPALIDKKHNTSFVQGASLGVRADSTDGHSLAGGLGALIDGGGENSFTAGFFAQGVGYWYGVGWLSAGAGKDHYKAEKYAQAAATHFAVGILHDTGGDDTYEVVQELGIGHGHDFGVGFLLDDGGNDVYRAPNFSLGCASAQGIGIFWDRAGDDRYISTDKEILGCASLRIGYPSTRVNSRTLGVFLDTDGRNEFLVPQTDLGSGKWKRGGLVVPPEIPERFKSRLIGIGRVVKDPALGDPL